MINKTRELLGRHIKENSNRYFLLFMAFIIGVSAGAFTVNGLSTLQTEELIHYFQGFIQLMEKQRLNSNEILMISLQDNAKIVILLWVLGLTIIGIPFIILLIIIRGFITGFSSGFIIKILGLKGALFNLFAILPKEFVIIPCIIALGVNGINFSLSITKSKSIKQILKENLKMNFIGYSMTTIFFSILILLGILVEAYIVPVFIRIITPIMTT
ncbi:MAG TPA: stage II sporulation protein M [Clostridiales bacterium]|nr:stage II sporulation protein M [Clostridiales bacterium]